LLHIDDLVHLKPGQLPAPFDWAVLLVPLYAQEQIGVVLLGPNRSQVGYTESELATLQYGADYLVDLIQRINIWSEALARLEEASLPVEPADVQVGGISPRQVELALRNLHDYAYLADTPLVSLRRVSECLACNDAGANTHIERGKAVSTVLTEAVEKLRPGREEPHWPVPRTWYPYLILRDAYLIGETNREIMARLYISEGTFNRTRRTAIRSVTRVLVEMEAA
jgi:hypothetical protein